MSERTSRAGIDWRRLLTAGLTAGVWVFISGLLMAASLAYRDMAAVVLYALLLKAYSATRALRTAAGFTWVPGAVLPYAVVVQWGLLPWSFAAKLWAWSAAELLAACAIGRFLYRPPERGPA